MEWPIFGIVVIWLGIVSWFDIRKNEVPHSLWVIVPFIGTGAYRVWQGGWQLVLIAVLIAAVSERERISQLFRWEKIRQLITWIPLVFLGVFLSMQTSSLATLAITGFWIAWELKWWGGADAVSAITLCLVWPDNTFFIAFLGCHAIVALGLVTFTYKEERKLNAHRLPGLPILLLAVFCTQLIRLLVNH